MDDDNVRQDVKVGDGTSSARVWQLAVDLESVRSDVDCLSRHGTAGVGNGANGWME